MSIVITIAPENVENELSSDHATDDGGEQKVILPRYITDHIVEKPESESETSSESGVADAGTEQEGENSSQHSNTDFSEKAVTEISSEQQIDGHGK